MLGSRITTRTGRMQPKQANVIIDRILYFSCTQSCCARDIFWPLLASGRGSTNPSPERWVHVTDISHDPLVVPVWCAVVRKHCAYSSILHPVASQDFTRTSPYFTPLSGRKVRRRSPTEDTFQGYTVRPRR